MSRRTNIGLLVAWLVFATLSLTYVWGGNPDAIPRPPESFSIWLSNLYGAQDAEDIGKLDVLYMLLVSFIAVSICTSLALFAWKSLRAQ
ncbi:MAG: hypothetical protein DM484_09535 [Candidatus Methylumidiphilus alinenensis]|uniref:Uncharacterized protein n=1 Tax=Candidatus Methylumidiphilus alinenensis TaxID=2202197 RepID=A0A2W4T0B3_9GAMM|nr:MAG: hypothetical protein DM484_09535 [Candidatus Methylumidiphilus alinenensis]